MFKKIIKGKNFSHIKFPVTRITLEKEEGFFQKLIKMFIPPPKGVKVSQISSMRIGLNLFRH